MAFELTRQAMGFRMLQLLAAPIQSMGREELTTTLNAIGRS
jgi:arsenate reductase